VSLLKGIANTISTVTTAAINIVTRFVGAIANNLGLVVTAGLNILTRLLGAIASRISDVIRMGTNIIVNFITGIGNAGARIVAAAVSAITKFINAVAKGALRLVDVGATAIIHFLNGVAAVINQRAPEMRAAGASIGLAIADGMSFGLASKAASLAQKAADLGHGALNAIRHAVGAKSPSTEAYVIGQFLVAGLANGMSDNKSALASANNLGRSVITMFKDVFQITSPSKVMQDIGKEVGRGFADGIRGSTDDIKGAFQHLNDNLTEAMTKARETIASEQDKLDKLRAAKKPDAAAIKEAQKIISENEDILRRSTAGHIALVKTLNDEKQELIGLVKEYEKIADKLKEAQSALDDARKVQEDAIRGFTSQFSTAPDISELLVKDIKSARETISAEQKKYDKMVSDGKSDEEALNNAKASIVSAQDTLNTLIAGKTLDAGGNAVDQLATYMEALRHQTDAVGAYAATLQQLRKLGLDDATYQKLLKEGTADQSFANQLLSGGKTAVDSLNALDRQLFDVSSKLAVNAGNNLYQAGVDAAEGLVKGLESRKTKIRKTMEDIAREILQTLKKELKIKSPSEEFAQIGKFAMAGMAQGFSSSSKMVTDAVNVAAHDALTAMQKSMRDISDVVTNELDTNPVITPILDLTQIQARSQELAALTNVPITASASFGLASSISSAQTATSEEIPVAPGATSVKFEQNNYSPEALTEIEIYRQTRNQLSQLKSVLALP
jgi:CRISPR/Cas system-associated endonuclease Cas3-HD